MPTRHAATLRQILDRHWLAAATISASTLWLVYVLTDGTFQLSAPTLFCCPTYYDALGEEMLGGRFDVPAEAIGVEAIIVDGRFYGYFGPTPAVPRIVLNALAPEMRGMWTRWSMAAAALVTLLASYWILLQAREAREEAMEGDGRRSNRALDALYLLLVAGGTSLVYLMWKPVIYHEASMVGVAFALLSFALSLEYARSGRLRALVAAIVTAFLALHARASVGAGPIATLGVIGLLQARGLARRRLHPTAPTSPALAILERPELLSHLVCLTLLLSAGLGGTILKNLSTFGTISGHPGLSRHIQLMNDPDRVARTGGEFFQPLNLRTTLVTYLSPTSISIRPRFPWLAARPASILESPEARLDLLERYPEARLDHVEPYASLTVTNPIWLVLTLLGSVHIARRASMRPNPFARFRPILIGAAVGGSTIFVVAFITQRYLHDLFPLFVIAGAVAWQGLIMCLTLRTSRWTVAAVALLAVVNLYANIAVSLSMLRWV
jgi:hypothetical protein